VNKAIQIVSKQGTKGLDITVNLVQMNICISGYAMCNSVGVIVRVVCKHLHIT